MLDLVFHGGFVLTQATAPAVTAVGVQSGRVAMVGDDRSVLREAGAATRRIDLGGRTLIPGFNDAHAHIWKIGHLLTTMVDLRRVESLDALTEQVRRAADRLPGDAWVLGRGYNEAAMRERTAPTRDDLDRAAPGRAVVLTRTCGHIYAASSRALEAAGIGPNTEAPGGGVIERDRTGRPNGLLHETAMGLINRVMPPPTQADFEAMIAAALRHQLSLGITSSADCGVSPQLLSVYRSMDANGELPSRINVMPLRLLDGDASPVLLPDRFVSDMLRVDTVKLLADGGLSGATAALSVPYRHADTRGVLRFSTADLKRLCAESHRAGWRIATHAIGDVAIDQVLEVYESLGPHPLGLAHRIEHFGLPDAAQLAAPRSSRSSMAPQTISSARSAATSETICQTRFSPAPTRCARCWMPGLPSRSPLTRRSWRTTARCPGWPPRSLGSTPTDSRLRRVNRSALARRSTPTPWAAPWRPATRPTGAASKSGSGRTSRCSPATR
jgi:predicted amidohydrolase YtcJ